MKTILTWGVIIFIGFYLVTQPTAAGHFMSSGFNGLRDVGTSLARFVDSTHV
jgi:hypothetical protein